MLTCLDSSNTVYSDYLQGYTQLPSDRKTVNVQYSEYYPVVESMVQWQGESFPTWITTSPAPNLADSSVTTQGNMYISTVDMHMPSAVRPIQRHEWCRLLGFDEEYRKKIYSFKPEAVDFLLQRIVPKHTIKTVMTLLLIAERRTVKSRPEMVEIKGDGDEASYLCNPKHDHWQWCEAPSFLVIN
jgi:hypothetical protein